MTFKEEFIHFIWKYKRFDHRHLTTTDGESLRIDNYGMHNHGSGPDFHNARIAIQDTLWAGNVEMHLRSSDWKRHKHQNDKAYDNVILHVVHTHDEVATNSIGQEIPTLVLKGKIDPVVISNYKRLNEAIDWVPCAPQLPQVDPLIIHQAMDRAMIQRLQRKAHVIEQSLKYYNNDWNKVCYQSIASSLGAKINQSPFEHLARITPLEMLAKSGDQLFQLEAMLFGQAGFLNELPKDEYQASLTKEYEFLKHKYKLQSMKKESWQFSGLRPASFPHIRIAQLAKLVHHQPTLFSKLKSLEKTGEIDDLFAIQLEGYWLTHYNFTKSSKSQKKTIGKTVRNNMMINSIVPILFHYGDKMNDDIVKERALSFLEDLDAERNSIVKRWGELGVTALSTHDSQALLELKNECCTFRKCLDCPIGVSLLRT